VSTTFDPRPQAQIQTVSTTRNQAFRGPYVDQAITYRNVTNSPVTPFPSARNSTAPVTVYDIPGVNHDPSNPARDMPAAKVAWVPGRDPYKTDGMVGQDFFKNASGA
jgi:hypothetical protein